VVVPTPGAELALPHIQHFSRSLNPTGGEMGATEVIEAIYLAI